jgi:protein-disulfide isomerase
MKPSVIIALIVGGVIGFAVGNMVKPNSGSPLAGPLAALAPSPNGARPTAAPPSADTSVFKVNVGSSAAKGPANALITLVEFSDYQCPFCSRGNATVEQIEKEYEGKIRVVMKQHPLEFHPNAKPAALAALAAGEQGKYWEMHHKLFANQQNLDAATFEGYAKELGLNVDKWKADMLLPKFQQQIAAETAEALAIGAGGTPAFYINGRKLSGAQPVESFRAIIDQELGKAQDLVKTGTPADQVYAKIMATAQTAPAPSPAAPPAAPAVRKVEFPADSPAKGGKNAKVTIVAYSDFQCPFCSRVVPTLKQIEDTYGDNVKVVFRNQPLPFHNNAKIAAEAGMAANEQGKFWQMHDKMFANQQALDRPNLEKYGSEIGLDMGKFKSALDSGKFTKRVEEDSAAGMAVGANGTPTFFVNGHEFVGAQPFEAFKTIIDSEMKNAEALLAKGIKPDMLYAELMKIAANTPAAAAPAAAAPEAPRFVKDLKIEGAPMKGGKNAKVTIVAFSDFQCPYCSRVVPTLKQIHDTYGDKIKVVFMHQPLPFHNNAKPAAMASMAANEQGKFWEYHDKLFANQQALERANLEQYAKDLGLDMGKFKASLDSNKFDAVVAANSAEGMRVGANGTPTFFINGREFVGAQPFEAFKNIIDEELKK